VYETLVRQRSVQGTFYLGFAFRAQAVELMSYKVLVVDDSKLARMAVAKLLRALHPDWTHIEAASADEALAVLKEKEADLVVVDFNMPGRDGLDLASEFRETVPTMAKVVYPDDGRCVRRSLRSAVPTPPRGWHLPLAYRQGYASTRTAWRGHPLGRQQHGY
jgi:CheY-like chemotaxis protein